MNAKELRQKYVAFFESKGHTRHASAPLVPIDVTGKLDQSLLFTGAGMVQFKPYFRGVASPPSPRLVTSQKCVRAKDIEEVGNPAHLTFFEMLGSFSFGDYFKATAIDYAWEFLTSPEWLALQPGMLCVTVFEEDEEAFQLWSIKWREAGLNPDERIIRLGEGANYWPAGALSAGPPGPCGPCSEIFYRTVPADEMTGDYIADEAAGRWLEIWNLVFMQYEWRGVLRDSESPYLGYQKISMDPLPQQNIDTGMGLERTARVLNGFGSVYDTDVFSPIVQAVEQIANITYGADEQQDRAIRVISDHMRTASFCIADGILPSNTGRGYVLRRLIRRSILKGTRVLGIESAFLESVFPAVVEALGNPYVELAERADAIRSTLALEEASFLKTMRLGHERFDDVLREKGAIDGLDAFFLYDTFGFPFEVTQELAQELGHTIDENQFRQALEDAQDKSRSAQGASDVFGGEAEAIMLAAAVDAPLQSTFVGYDRVRHASRLVQISPRFDNGQRTTGHFQICLEETPFYAESGGQVGDTGLIESDDFAFRITNTWKEMGQIWHDAEILRFAEDLVGLGPEQIGSVLQSNIFFSPVLASVDEQRRLDIMRNHTATHLLHAALRETLGRHVTQAGSLVAPDRLRFDFTHGKGMAEAELRTVEEEVNRRISSALPVRIHWNVPIDEARQIGAMMLFGEKYGDLVRVVDVPGFSVELCGGTHVNNVAEIGMFKILSESSSASGVRRIEAVTGYGAYEKARDADAILREASKVLKSRPADLATAVSRLQDQFREARKNVAPAATAGIDGVARTVAKFTFYSGFLNSASSHDAKLAVDQLIEADPNGVGLVVAASDGKVAFFCKVGKKALANGAHAGKIAKAAAQAAGGDGGGSPAFAQAGGKDPGRTEEAIEAAVAALANI
ncbi:MAG: alanine--tRNA ligase [Armatimonadota bacterium]|nr:alanine--tRNA ligase [Armatimonadota bacterium]